MPPFKLQLRAATSPALYLRATFATCKSRCRALPPGPRGTVRRSSPPIPLSKRPLRRTQGSSKGPELPINPPPAEQQSSLNVVSDALRDSTSNSLLSPVHVPDDPDGVLRSDHPATSILSHASVVVTRQLELMNVMIGFEQANKYVIMDPQGNHIGYMAERELGMGNMMARQMFSTHRSFTTHVFDKQGKEVLRFHRPFAWISSRIGVYDPVEIGKSSYSPSKAMATSAPGSLSTEVNPDSTQVSPLAISDMRIIGQAQQQWAPLRRKYNLFVYRHAPTSKSGSESQQGPPPAAPLSNSQAMDLAPYNEEGGNFSQFAYVDEPFLSWDFSLFSSDSKLIGSVNRNFAGFGREIFTDTGIYALRMDAAGLSQEPQHLISKTGQQAQAQVQAQTEAEQHQSPSSLSMTLDQRAVMLATAVSVDFDYFSRKSGSGGGMGFMPMWFPGGGGGGAAAGEAGAEAGGVMEGAGGVGAKEEGAGAAVGAAGSMAGYEAMQRGAGSPNEGAAAPSDPTDGQQQPQQPTDPNGSEGLEGEVWGNNERDPWGGDSGDDGGGGDDGSGGGDGGGDWGDWF